MMKPLKVGLVGTGNISWYHLAAYNQFPEIVKLTAVCDIREDAMKEFAGKANVSACFTDFEEMLRKADIDAVDICTTHDQHEPEVIAAALAGKHVLVEKPMARNIKECRKMLTATERAGVTYMVGQCQRYTPHARAIKQLIDKGEIGKVRVTRCNLMSSMPPSANYSAGHWLVDGKIAGGGMLLSGIIHQVDLLRYFIGDIKRVSGVCRTVHPQYINGAEEYASATLEFENGAIGDIMVIYSSIRYPVTSLQYTIIGDEGTIYSTPAENKTLQFGPGLIASARREKSEDEYGRFVPIAPIKVGLTGDDPFVNEIVHFADCCRDKKDPITSGKDNLGTVKTIFGIYESARTGNKIDLSTL
jgi:predicted dehydrogenase